MKKPALVAVPLTTILLLAGGQLNGFAIFSNSTKTLQAKLESSVLGNSGDYREAEQIANRLPISFEQNNGQTNEAARFLSRIGDSSYFFGPGELRINSPKGALKVQMAGSNKNSSINGAGELGFKTNYFQGSDPKGWITGIPSFASIRNSGVYPGIDLVYYGRDGHIEYDFQVSPGADPNAIQMKFEGIKGLNLRANGNLVVDLGSGKLVQRKPIAYQLVAGIKRPVLAEFRVSGPDTVSFVLGRFDRTKPLTIDPILYSGYLGGGGVDRGFGLALENGCTSYCSVFLTGTSASADFPGTSTSLIQPTYRGSTDAFVAKLNSKGTALEYATYLGGTASELGRRIAVDEAGFAYVIGQTNSSNFPATGQTTCSISPPAHTSYQCFQGDVDVFVAKLNATGDALSFATFLGGSQFDFAGDIAVDGAHNVYLGGSTSSGNFPVTPVGAYQGVKAGPCCEEFHRDAFVTVLNPTGSGHVYSTYIGGSTGALSTYLGGAGIETLVSLTIDGSGKIYIAGTTASTNFPVTLRAFQQSFAGTALDMFVAKLNPNPSDTDGNAGNNADVTDLQNSTYLGGSGDEAGGHVALQPGCPNSCDVYVSGASGNSSFPTTPAAYGATTGPVVPLYGPTMSKLDLNLGNLIYSGRLEDNTGTSPLDMVVDGKGNASILDITDSPFWPTIGPLKTAPQGVDFALAKFNAKGSALLLSTYLGGADDESSASLTNGGMAVSSTGQLYLHSSTLSSNYPFRESMDSVLGGAEDAVVTKLSAAGKERVGDFNSNGATDLSVYRNGTWYLQKDTLAGQALPFSYGWGGDPADKIVPGDYNGDGYADTAVYRNGYWYVNHQQGIPYDGTVIRWGGDPTDIPVPADYDGDGDTDFAVYRASTGTWYVNRAEGLPSDVSANQWGGDSTDKAVPGDYDSDGDSDIAVYRSSTGNWYVNDRPDLDSRWGGDSNDKPVPGDYDGDGDWDFAVWRSNTGYWYVKDQPALGVQWGGHSSDLPVAADYNRDGKSDIAVYRKTTGYWYVKGQFERQWGGDATDVPIPLPLAMR